MIMSFSVFFLLSIIVLAVLAVMGLVRAVVGPKLADRIMAVNLIGTMTIAIIAIISVLLGEAVLLDVALIYAAISFVSVIVLTKIYIGIYRERKFMLEKKSREQEGEK